MFSLRSRRGTKKQTESVLDGKRILTVAHNHPEFFPGGGEIMAYQLYEQFRDAGMDSRFLAATGRIDREPHQHTPFMAMHNRADEFLFHNDAFDYFNQSHRDPAFLAREWPRFLKEHKPDIVHFHHALRYGVEALTLTRRTLPDAKIIYTLHDYIPICHRDGQMLRKTDNALCHGATPDRCHSCFPDHSAAQFRLRERFIKTHFDAVDLFLAPSRFLASQYINWGLPSDKVRVMENGVEAMEPVPPRTVRRGGKRNHFVYLGQISPYKGTPLLIEATRLLREKGITDFSVAIHGRIGIQDETFQEDFAQQLADATPQVHARGPYRREELPTIIADADWVIVPSIWWENAPLVIGEALHHGRPVICSNIGGMAEKIEDGVNGLHFRAGSAHSLADIMEQAIEDHTLWDQLVATIAPPVTMQDCAANHLELFASLLLEEDREEPQLERKKSA